ERLILNDRATDTGPELIHVKGRNRGTVKRRTRIENIVSQILEGRAVELIRARSRHNVDLTACRRTALGCIHCSTHAELRDGLQGNLQSGLGLLRLLLDAARVNAVECEIIVVT